MVNTTVTVLPGLGDGAVLIVRSRGNCHDSRRLRRRDSHGGIFDYGTRSVAGGILKDEGRSQYALPGIVQ